MISRSALASVAAVFLLVASAAQSAEEAPYLGHWSNGRGETLVVTEESIRVGDGRALSYRDVTRVTDGSTFELQITARGDVAAFGGKTLGVSCEDDSMKITAYASHAAYMQGEDPQSVVTWFKDEDAAEDE